MEFCEHHLSGLNGTIVALYGTVVDLFPIQNEGNTSWSERLAARW
jgi:hypothetical protein